MVEKNNRWKIIAIIFIALFGLLLLYNIWGIISYYNEVEKTDICYYDVCNEYPQAILEGNICSCYDYDLTGDLIVSKTKILK